jgi:hypothetical protein
MCLCMYCMFCADWRVPRLWCILIEQDLGVCVFLSRGLCGIGGRPVRFGLRLRLRLRLCLR